MLVRTSRKSVKSIAGETWRERNRMTLSRQAYVLNDFWHQILTCDKPAIIITAPRDVGKTAAAVQLLNPENPFSWAKPDVIGAWCSIEYKHIKESFVPEAKRRIPGLRHVKDDAAVYIPGGGTLWTFTCRDTEGVDRIRGIKEPEYWIFEECCFYHPDFFPICEYNFRPGVRRLYITSKKAGTFIHELVLKGAPADPDYFAVFDYPMDEQGYPIKPAHLTQQQWMEKVLRAERTTPRLVFERECLNRWGLPSGGVFLGTEMAFNLGAKLGVLSEGVPVAFGLDLGQTVDYTALVACTRDGAMFPMLHTQGISWDMVAEKVKPIWEKYGGGLPIWVDATGYGSPVIEILCKHGIRCYGVTMGALPYKDAPLNWKEQLVLDFSVASERNEVAIAHSELGEKLVHEMYNFLYHPLPSGRYRYEANNECHDDMVTAAMLAWSASRRLGYAKQGSPPPTSTPTKKRDSGGRGKQRLSKQIS